MATSGRDIWSLIAEEKKAQKKKYGSSNMSASHTSSVLFLGNQGSGKSTIIQSFLKPTVTKEPKSTFALEYSFARRKISSSSSSSSSSSGSVGKTVAHIWELGGEMSLEAGFLDIPLSTRSICEASAIICIDLSKPQNIFSSLQKHFEMLKTVIRKRIGDLNASDDNKSQIQSLRDFSARLLNANHIDGNKMRAVEIPCFLIATKFDIFKNLPLQDRRLVTQVMRFFAHYYGAHLLTSSSDASQKESLRSTLSSICFQTPLKTGCEVLPEKPLSISPGSDSFDSILLGGPAKGNDGDAKVSKFIICSSPFYVYKLF